MKENSMVLEKHEHKRKVDLYFSKSEGFNRWVNIYKTEPKGYVDIAIRERKKNRY